MIALRPAVHADAQQIAAVHVATWRDAYANILPTDMLIGLSVDRYADDWRRTLMQQRQRESITVAAAGDAVVGFATAGPARRTADTDRGEVTMLYVLGDYQERGLGRALLRASFGGLLCHGMTAATIWVVRQNPSRFFYEAMGGVARRHRTERLWSTTVPTVGYAWDDLAAAIGAMDDSMARMAGDPGAASRGQRPRPQ